MGTDGPGAGGEIERGARPRIGLALSGGGARGVAHIGVLRVLEECRVPIDYIAGTSMGALVGGLYASGVGLDDLEDLVTSIDWMDILVDYIPRKDRSFRRKRDDDLYLMRQKAGVKGMSLSFPPGILDGQKIDLMLKRQTVHVSSIEDFDDLPIPFRAVAADIVNGEAVVLDGGDLALALRASMALPGIFAPRMIGGRMLVDGGISCNLPIDVVRSMGADIVIAVDISTPLQGLEDLGSVIAITNQLTGLLTRRNADMQIGTLGPEDIFLRPELGDITTGSFDRSAEAIPIGVEAAESVRPRLERLSVGDEAYGELRAARSRPAQVPVIDRIEIVNDSRISDTVIKNMIKVHEGDRLDAQALEKELIDIYGLELFESVYYDITSEGGETVMKVTVKERSWGPDYLQVGAVAYDDYEDVNFNISLAYTSTAMNSLGGEWRTGFQMGNEPGVFSEFYQPLDRRMRHFFKVKAAYLEQSDNLITSEGRKYSELGVYRYGLMFEIGRELGAWGRFSGGLKRESGKITVQVGDPEEEERHFDNGEVFCQFFLDELDDVNFPGSGELLRVRASAGLEELGSRGTYEQGTVDFRSAVSAGSLSFVLGGSFCSTLDDDAPYQNLFELGGFMRLSGLEQDELRGQHSMLMTGTVFKRIPLSAIVVLNAGFTVEYGNVFDSRNDVSPGSGIFSGSVFIGIDTLLGPLYAGCGLAEGGRSNCYFCLGIPMWNSNSMRLDR